MSLSHRLSYLLLVLSLCHPLEAGTTLTPSAPLPDSKLSGTITIEGPVKVDSTLNWGSDKVAYCLEGSIPDLEVLLQGSGESASLTIDGGMYFLRGIDCKFNTLKFKDLSLTIRQCCTQDGGSAICSIRDIEFNGNNNVMNILLSDNRLQGSSAHADLGAALCTLDGVVSYKNSTSSTFTLSNNRCISDSKISGGAGITAQQFLISNNQGGCLTCLNNVAENATMTIAQATGKTGAAILVYRFVAYANPEMRMIFRGNRIEGCTYGSGAALSLLSYQDSITTITSQPTSRGLFIVGSGSLEFSDNSIISQKRATGAAISMADSWWRDNQLYNQYGFEMTSNGSILFRNNQITGREVKGAAVHVGITPYFRIDNNAGTVEYRGNCEIQIAGNGTTTHRLRSVYVENAKSYELGAAQGQEFVFYDGFSLGSTYTDERTVLNPTADGTLRLSGRYTIEDLQSAGCTTPTEQEIADSRTGELAQAMDLKQGTLVLEDAAVLKVGQAAGVMLASRVEGGAKLSMSGASLYSNTKLEFGDGATLKLARGSVTGSDYSRIVTQGMQFDGALTLNIQGISYEKRATHFLQLTTPSLAAGTETVTLTLTGSEFLHNTRYNLVQWTDSSATSLLTTVGDTLTINGVTYQRDECLHWDNADNMLYLYLANNTPLPPGSNGGDELPVMTENSLWGTSLSMQLMGQNALRRLDSTKLLASGCRRVTRLNIDDDKGGRPRWPMHHEAWCEALTTYGRHAGQGAVQGYSFSGLGAAAGVDTDIPEHCELGRWGVALGRLHGNNNARSTDDKTKQDTTMVSFYWGKSVLRDMRHAWLLRAALTYGLTQNKSHRRDDADAHARFDSSAWLAQGEVVYQTSLRDRLRLNLTAGLEYGNARRDAFAETGVGALHYGAARLEELRLLPGVELEHCIYRGRSPWVNSLRLNYVVDLCRNTIETRAMRADGTPAYTVRSVDPSRHGLRASLQSRLQLNERWGLFADYSLEGRSHALMQQASVGATYAF